ncbi:restriction endonuclease subunit S [Roseateles sp. GG27B]
MSREMKASSVRWFESVPDKWGFRRLKDDFHVVGGGTPDAREIDAGFPIPWATPADFSDAEQALSLTSRNISNQGFREIGRNMVSTDGILLSCRAPAGKVALPMISVSFNQGCKGLSPRHSTNRNWFFYALVDQRAQIEELARGATFLEISGESVKRLVLPSPPPDEQLRIADWLDLQTARIDKRRELLAKKRELLQDLKKSVIQEATFRGIARGIELRDSEIAWLGTVPSHWTTVRIGSLFREAADDGVDGLPMLSVSIHSGISDKELDEGEMERKVSRSEDITLYKRVKPGDLVYNQMRAWQGAFGAAKIEGLVSPAYVVARPGPSVLPGFVEYLLRAPAAMEEIRRRSRGITEFRLRLYWTEFKNIRIALPPLKEQVEITAFLDRKLSQIARQITLIDQLDDLLKQQRKAIIHEAVTGKIDLSLESSFQRDARMCHLVETLPN